MLGKILGELVRAPFRRKDGRPESAAQPNHPSPLKEFFNNNPGRELTKWYNYFEIYDRHFARFRGRSPVVLEIGVDEGGSLHMWHEYFGAGTRVVGIDVNPACKKFEDEATTILLGDQADRAFLAAVRERLPRIDILIDDGGHRMEQQINTFEELYRHVQPHGIYLCEDMHTSLWPDYGAGYRHAGSFLEYTKALVDRLSAWHSPDPGVLAVDGFTKSTHSMHFYDSVVVIEKRPMDEPKLYVSLLGGN